MDPKFSMLVNTPVPSPLRCDAVWFSPQDYNRSLSFNSVYMFGFVCVQVRLYMNACRPEINLGCCSSGAIDLRQGVSPGPSEAQVPCPATFDFISGHWGTVQLLMLYGQAIS